MTMLDRLSALAPRVRRRVLSVAEMSALALVAFAFGRILVGDWRGVALDLLLALPLATMAAYLTAIERERSAVGTMLAVLRAGAAPVETYHRGDEGDGGGGDGEDEPDDSPPDAPKGMERAQ